MDEAAATGQLAPMSTLLTGIIGAVAGAGIGLQTHRVNQWLTDAEPEATGGPAAARGALGSSPGRRRRGAPLCPLWPHRDDPGWDSDLRCPRPGAGLRRAPPPDPQQGHLPGHPCLPLVLSPVNPLLAPGPIQVKVLSATIGAALGGGIFYILVVISRGGIGMGDAKLAFFLGAAIGLFPLPGSPVIRALVYGDPVLGAASALILLVTRVRGLRDYIAYGPYLCLGAIIEVLVFGAPP